MTRTALVFPSIRERFTLTLARSSRAVLARLIERLGHVRSMVAELLEPFVDKVPSEASVVALHRRSVQPSIGTRAVWTSPLELRETRRVHPSLPTKGRVSVASLRLLRPLVFALLVCALLAPKASLALVAVFGNGFSSVVICTGTGLTRVTVLPSGEIVDDVSESWTSVPCTLIDDDVVPLERAWQRFVYPSFSAAGIVLPVPVSPLPRAVRPACSGRGPPAV